MRQKVLTLLTIITLTWTSAFGWGKVGHDATVYIAECNLTPEAKATIEKYLDGHSIVYYSSWLDKVRSTPEYKHTNKAHTFTVNAGHKYKKRKSGDCVSFVMDQMELLRNYEQLPDSAVAVGIKILLHFVGDMHCPSHIRYPGRPQEKITFKLNGTPFEFHKFWDGTSLEGNHKWYYSDYQYQLDRCTPAEKEAIAAGTPIDWANENAIIIDKVYEWLTPDTNLDKSETQALMLKAEELSDSQILKGGYRLARILNELFGK